MANKTVAVVGDIFADMVTNILGYPTNGDSTYGTPLAMNGGGTGGNIAAGIAVLGAPVALVTHLGDDDTGRFLLGDMERLGVDVRGVCLDPDSRSGSVVITVDPSGERTIFVLARGSSYELLSEQDASVLAAIDPGAIFFTGFLIGAHPAEETMISIARAYKGRARLYLDPNLRYPPDAVPAEISSSMRTLAELCDVVLAGEIEMRALGLRPGPGKTFVVKNGGEGCYLLGADGQKLSSVPATPHRATDATGAGDAFSAAFLTAERDGMDAVSAMEFAAVAAGISVTRPGARGMPSRSEVEEYLKNWKYN